MAYKAWKEMSVEEKLEALREDVRHILTDSNKLNNVRDRQEEAISEIHRRIEQLEKKTQA
jgi:predicted nuclease with TOPRIM domain